MDELRLSTAQVAAFCGIPAGTLYDWLRYGVIACVPARARGKRYPGFSPRQITFIQLAAAMRKSQFGLGDIADALRVLHAGWDGQGPAQLLADPLGWTFGQQFLIRLNGHLKPLAAVPPVLYDVGKILAQVKFDLHELEAAKQEA